MDNIKLKIHTSVEHENTDRKESDHYVHICDDCYSWGATYNDDMISKDENSTLCDINVQEITSPNILCTDILSYDNIFDVYKDKDPIWMWCGGAGMTYLIIFSEFLYCNTVCMEYGSHHSQEIYLFNDSLTVDDCIDEIDNYLKEHVFVRLVNGDETLLLREAIDKYKTEIIIHSNVKNWNKHIIRAMQHITQLKYSLKFYD